MGSTGEIKEFVKMAGESAILKYKEFRGVQIAYRIDDNMIHLTELSKFLAAKYKISFDLYRYLDTKEFYTALMNEDNSLTPKENVYLLDFQNGVCKIGKTFRIDQRYDGKTIDNYLVSLYTVDNSTSTEQEILKEMRKTYKEVEGKREYFNYTSISTITRLFNSIASKHKIALQQYDSKLLDFSEIKSHYFNGIYGHSDVAKIVIKKFCSVPADLKNWLKLIDSHKYEIGGATLNIIKDETNGKDNLFWYFNGYVFIKTVDTNFYNASRLVNSIIRTDGNKSSKRLNQFLKNDKRFNRSKIEFKTMFGIDGVIDNTETTTSKLKGIYVHEYLLPSVLRWVSPSYELITNIFISEMSKIMASDKSAEEKMQEMKDLMKLTILKNTDKIKLSIKQKDFNINQFVPTIMSGGDNNSELIMNKIEFEE